MAMAVVVTAAVAIAAVAMASAALAAVAVAAAVAMAAAFVAMHGRLHAIAGGCMGVVWLCIFGDCSDVWWLAESTFPMIRVAHADQVVVLRSFSGRSETSHVAFHCLDAIL